MMLYDPKVVKDC